MACIDNQIVPTPPKDWTPPPGWRPPNEKDRSTGLYVHIAIILFIMPKPVYFSTTKFKQQLIMGYTQKTVGTKQPILVMKEGIKEHFLAIITTCDLVRDIALIYAISNYIP